MGLAILVLGFSGSGKSASLRNFKEDELALVNVNGKQLPFRTQFKSTIHTDNYGEIERFMKAQTAKSIAVDDSQYLMVNEFMRRAKETGYQKFTDIAKNFWELVRSVEMLPEDVIVYFLNHLDTGEDGRQKAKTIGKLLDEKITVEGMFTTEAAYELAARENVEMPITEAIYRVIKGDMKAADAVDLLMGRDKKHEQG